MSLKINIRKILREETKSFILENKTKYDYGFIMLKKLISMSFPYFINFKVNRVISGNDINLIHIDVTFDRKKFNEQHGYYDDELLSDVKIHFGEEFLELYDKVPRNIRHNFPDNHKRFGGMASGIIIDNIIFI
jgi:hypothetical protein